MRNIRSGSSRRQQGFIQGAILFSLALLVVIIGAFAAASTSTTSSTDNERDRVNAAVVVKVGVDIQNAFDRALQDGYSATKITAESSSSGGNVALFDTNYNYGSPPQVPTTALASGSNATYTIAQSSSSLVGGTGNETLVLIGNLTKSVCNRAAAIANGVAYSAAEPATSPASNQMAGCYDSGTGGTHTYNFYRVLATS